MAPKEKSSSSPSRSRIQRGRETEFLLTKYLQDYWPEAAFTSKSAAGDDVINVGKLAVEAKATAHVPILGALRQVHARAADGQIPIVVWRPNGYGPERISDWIVASRVSTFFGPVAFRAGYFNE